MNTVTVNALWNSNSSLWMTLFESESAGVLLAIAELTWSAVHQWDCLYLDQCYCASIIDYDWSGWLDIYIYTSDLGLFVITMAENSKDLKQIPQRVWWYLTWESLPEESPSISQWNIFQKTFLTFTMSISMLYPIKSIWSACVCINWWYHPSNAKGALVA